MSVGIRPLHAALVLAWGEDTAYHRQWDKLCPDMNQCAVTALVVQDCLGGDLLECRTTNGNRHFWNRLPNRREVDFTRAQFEYLGEFPMRDEKRTIPREVLLQGGDVGERYKALKARVEAYLDGLG